MPRVTQERGAELTSLSQSQASEHCLVPSLTKARPLPRGGPRRLNWEGTGEDVGTRIHQTQNMAFLRDSLLLLPVTTYGYDTGALSK